MRACEPLGDASVEGRQKVRESRRGILPLLHILNCCADVFFLILRKLIIVKGGADCFLDSFRLPAGSGFCIVLWLFRRG